MTSRTFIVIVLLLFATTGFAARKNPYFIFSEKSKIQYFGHGCINWTKGYFLARAKGSLSSKKRNSKRRRQNSSTQKLELEEKLIHRAKQHLLNIILKTKVDTYNLVGDYFEKSHRFKELFLDKVRNNIIVLPPTYRGSNQMEVVVKYYLYGKNSLADLIFQLNNHKEDFPKEKKEYSTESIVYSSIIIDLRSKYQFRHRVSEKINTLPSRFMSRIRSSYLRKKLRYDSEEKKLYFKGKMRLEHKEALLDLAYKDRNFVNAEQQLREYRDGINDLYNKSQDSEKSYSYSPSVFPSIYDSNGNLLFSKDMIEKRLRSVIRYAKYTKDHLLMYKIEIVGKNPYYILADKIKGENNTDIIINRENAKKILLDQKTINNLKRGKIFLLVD